MKYAQLLMGLLIGTALGSSVVAATGKNDAPTAATGSVDAEAVRKIVREVIEQEPKLIMDSVQKFQIGEREKEMKGAAEILKDAAFKAQMFDTKTAATTGPADSKKVVVEFFDYNCPACKMQYKAINELIQKDKTARIIFREFPIFGPASEANSKIGLAVSRLAPEKYFGFYEKMSLHEGRADEKIALGFAKELGLDVEKVKAEAAKSEVAAILTGNRALAEKLRIQGTPSLVIGEELIPHAASPEELKTKLDALVK